MTTVEGRFPGGRKQSETMDDVVGEGEGCVSRLSPQHRTASQSLPRFGSVNDPRKVDTIPDELNKSYTLDRKKKRAPSFRTFGNFMQKMVRQMSQSSLNSPKTQKRRSHSSSRKETRQSQYGNKSSDGVCLFLENGKVPGVVGIRNHGNTCFMNAVLQCLSHTDLLVGYFITDQYKYDIKRNNKQNAKKFGTKGELTEHLVQLLKSLWTREYTGDISSDFKSVVGKFCSQYRGYAQHDAQEFLMWLLDKVHEDLNIASKKKYRANKSSHGRPDDVVAAEALANHTRCNNSFVYDLFQALYRSSLTCPNCRRQSNTFDPFLSVSLPIPQKTRRPVYVTVVYLDAHPKQVRIGLLMAQGDTVRDLRQTLSSDTRIPQSQLLLVEIYYDGFHRTFVDSNSLSDIHETDNVYAIETPQAIDPPQPAPGQYVTSYVTVVVLNKQGISNQGRRFGGPLVLQVRRDTTFLDLQNDILHNMMGMLREGLIPQKMGVLFRLKVMDGFPGKCYLLHDVDHPLEAPTVDRALSTCASGGGPQHMKLLVEWDQQTKQCMIAECEDVIEEHASVKQVQMAHLQPEIGTLDECFQLYTQEERLGGDDAWLCPNCRKQQQGTIKSLGLYTLPDILVIHLKRFKQDGVKRTKLNTLITFPVVCLDMSHHVSHSASSHHQGSSSSRPANTGWSPWRPSRRSPSQPEDYYYDLYAVCNHYGNMQGGHYTAFCKNAADSEWYSFDDIKVTRLVEEEVVTRAAYLLFYQRRSAYTASTSPSSPHHWLQQLHNIRHTGNGTGAARDMRPKTSRSHEDLLDDTSVSTGVHNTTADTLSQPHSGFTRSVQAYATMRPPVRPKSSQSLINPYKAPSPPPPPNPPSAALVKTMEGATNALDKSATPVVMSPAGQGKRPPLVKSESATMPRSGFSPPMPRSDSGSMSLGGTPTLRSREIPRIDRSRLPMVRSASLASQTPDVSIPSGETVTRGRNNADQSKSQEQLPQWDYTRTIFLQESCV